MEQTTQQTIQKPPLPTKTKIAAWWIIIIGGVVILDSLMVSPGVISFFSIIPLFVGLFLSIISYRLILRKKRADWVAIIIILSIILFYSFLTPFIPSTSKPIMFPLFLFLLFWYFWYLGWFSILFLFAFPFILLLLDRKNFWKVAK